MKWTTVTYRGLRIHVSSDGRARIYKGAGTRCYRLAVDGRIVTGGLKRLGDAKQVAEEALSES